VLPYPFRCIQNVEFWLIFGIPFDQDRAWNQCRYSHRPKKAPVNTSSYWEPEWTTIAVVQEKLPALIKSSCKTNCSEIVDAIKLISHASSCVSVVANAEMIVEPNYALNMVWSYVYRNMTKMELQ